MSARQEPVSGQIPSLWRVRMVDDEGRRYESLVVARNEPEIAHVMVEPGFEHLIVSSERIGTIPFGPGVVA